MAETKGEQGALSDDPPTEIPDGTEREKRTERLSEDVDPSRFEKTPVPWDDVPTDEYPITPKAIEKARKKRETIAVLRPSKHHDGGFDVTWLKHKPGENEVEVPFGVELHNPDGDSASLDFDQEKVVVGRGSTCDVYLAARTVSRRHAEIRRNGQLFALVDLDSPNGTRLNGERIEGMVQLRNGDDVEIGKYHLVFTAHLPEDQADRHPLA